MNAIREIEATSADGTVIGVQVTGSGPPLVLVHGGTADRTRWTPLLPLLGDQFTVITFDRRGRGASANEAPAYAIEREGEDLLAVLATAGEPALVFAHSYGATVTLTVLDRLPATAVLLYEPPFDTEHFQISPDEQLERWIALLDQGEREAVLESFYRETLAFDEESLDRLRQLPIWQARIAAVHTIVREVQALRTFRPPLLRPAMPVRVLIGETTTPQLAASTRQAAAALEGCELITLDGQGHAAIDTEPDVIAAHITQTWGAAQA